MEQKRTCKKCLKAKSLSCFELRSDNGRYRGSCRNCSSLRKKDWYEKNKLSYRIITAIKKYKITESDYYDLIDTHNGRCAICNMEETAYESSTGKPKSLSIDHNHKSGRVRGLLCWRCNAMIGYAKENIDTLKSAISYLKRYE